MPRIYCSSLTPPIISFSKRQSFKSLYKNQLSIIVTRCISSGVYPRFNASNTAKRRSSVASRIRDVSSSSESFVIVSRFNVSSDISAPRTAFIIAASKLSAMDITSPVAFICVPSSRFA